MWHLHTPDEKLDYHQDWSDWIEVGDELAISEWSILPNGLPVLSGEGLDVAAHLTTVMVSGLTLGTSYQLRNTVTTVVGRIGQRDKILRCAAY